MEDTPEDDNAKKEKKPEDSAPETKIAEEPSLDDEIEEAVSGSSVQAEKKKIKKKRIKQGIAGAVVLLLVYGIHLGLKPYKGTMAFGICKVFLELNIRYPNTLRISKVEERGASVRMWYTQTDAFGAYRMEPIQCYFKKDEKLGFILDRVTVRRRELDPKIVESFNKSLPVVFAHPPDLTKPRPLPDSLKGLKIETHLFRAPIL